MALIHSMRVRVLFLSILFAFCFSNSVFSQCNSSNAGGPCCDSPLPPGTDPGCSVDCPPCPIDGGISLLLAAGIGLGAARNLKQKRKKIGFH